MTPTIKKWATSLLTLIAASSMTGAALAENSNKIKLPTSAKIQDLQVKCEYKGKDICASASHETQYFIGGFGKTLTAYAILRLVHQGHLKLTDTVQTHIKEAGDRVGKLTIADLLIQKNELIDPFDNEQWKNSKISFSEVLNYLEGKAIDDYVPCSYSDGGYIILEEIITRQTKLAIDAAYAKLLPKGAMSHSNPIKPSETIPGSLRNKSFDRGFWQNKASFSNYKLTADAFSAFMQQIESSPQNSKDFLALWTSYGENGRGIAKTVSSGFNGTTNFYEDEDLGDYISIWVNDKYQTRLIVVAKNNGEKEKFKKYAEEVYNLFYTRVLSMENGRSSSTL